MAACAKHHASSMCAVLCCAVLCCAVLCCAVLCCAVLCCAVLCCAVLCCAVLDTSLSQRSVTHYAACGTKHARLYYCQQTSLQSAVIAVQVYKTEGPWPTPRHEPPPDPPSTSSLLPVHETPKLRDIARRSRALLGSKMPSAGGKRPSKKPASQKAEEQDGKKQPSLSVRRGAVKVAQMGSWICMFCKLHVLLFIAHCNQHCSLCASAGDSIGLSDLGS